MEKASNWHQPRKNRSTHLREKWSKLDWENQNFIIIFCGCCQPDNSSLDLPLPSTMATRQLDQWPGHSLNFNFIQNWWRSIPIPFHSITSHSIQFPFHFSFPFLTTCLWSVIASKRVDRFSCGWCQSLAFSQCYMIHVKKSKIGQEKAKLWGVDAILVLWF